MSSDKEKLRNRILYGDLDKEDAQVLTKKLLDQELDNDE